MRVQVVGLKELDAALGQLPEAFRREVVLKAMRRAAAPVVAEARSRAHRSSGKPRRGKYGDEIGPLADSIKVAAVKPNPDYPTEIAVKVGPDEDHYYGRFVEKGTRKRARIYRNNQGWRRQNTRSHAATRPFPYLEPAFETHKERVIEAAGKELWVVLAEKARSLAKGAESGSLSGKAREALL